MKSLKTKKKKKDKDDITKIKKNDPSMRGYPTMRRVDPTKYEMIHR